MKGDKWTILVVGFLTLLFLNSTILTLAIPLNIMDVYSNILSNNQKKNYQKSIAKIPIE